MTREEINVGVYLRTYAVKNEWEKWTRKSRWFRTTFSFFVVGWRRWRDFFFLLAWKVSFLFSPQFVNIIICWWSSTIFSVFAYVCRKERGRFLVSSSSRSPLHRNQMTGGTHGERTSRNFGDASAHCNVESCDDDDDDDVIIDFSQPSPWKRFFSFRVSHPLRSCEKRNKEIYSQNNKYLTTISSFQSFPSLHVPKILCSTWSSSYYFAVAQFVDLLTDRYPRWMHGSFTSASKKVSQPRNIEKKKNFCIFFFFLLVFISSNYFTRQSNQNMKTLSTQSPRCDWTNHRVDPSRMMPTDKNGRQ